MQISYIFNNPTFFEIAVTHKSWYNENSGIHQYTAKDFERLEFLGDAVLKAIQAKHVFKTYPEWDEGQLSKTRSHLENNQQLALWCHHLGLDSSIKTGHSILPHSKAWNNICAQVFEAYVGAIWQDCDYDFNCIFDLYVSWELPVRDQDIVSHKNLLQEYVQKKTFSCSKQHHRASCNININSKDDPKIISYETLEQAGPSHDPSFSVRCTVMKWGAQQQQGKEGKEEGQEEGQQQQEEEEQPHFLHTMGCGTSRKQAETEAARLMLTLLLKDPPAEGNIIIY
jgi:dsRNA-specific ribonuclease